MSAPAETSDSVLFATGPKPRPWTLDALLERAGEWLNPILVKEVRQALKSRQFVITFALVLLYSWGVSVVGLALVGPQAAYGANGPTMFAWYYAGLAFCLLIVVPYGAFRSLAVEQEERTYELLTITALRPRQIVSGKLASALVQILVYLSALSLPGVHLHAPRDRRAHDPLYPFLDGAVVAGALPDWALAGYAHGQPRATGRLVGAGGDRVHCGGHHGAYKSPPRSSFSSHSVSPAANSGWQMWVASRPISAIWPWPSLPRWRGSPSPATTAPRGCGS